MDSFTSLCVHVNIGSYTFFLKNNIFLFIIIFYVLEMKFILCYMCSVQDLKDRKGM